MHTFGHKYRHEDEKIKNSRAGSGPSLLLVFVALLKTQKQNLCDTRLRLEKFRDIIVLNIIYVSLILYRSSIRRLLMCFLW